MNQSAEKFDVLLHKIFQQAQIERAQNSRLDGLLKTLKPDGKLMAIIIIIANHCFISL